MAGQETTLYSIKEGAAWITLNRPEARNALSAELVNEMYAHLTAANNDEEVRSIIITGAGTAFCSGADLKSPPGELVAGQQAITYPDLLDAILKSEKPVITAVNGPAFAGGIGLVAAADIAITTTEAIYSFSEVRIGVIPAVIAVVCIPKLGTHHAMKLFLTGERFNGADAEKMGLTHRAVTAEDLMSAVQEEIDMINLGGPLAVKEAKKLVRRISEISVAKGFEEAGPWSKRLFESEEGTEGMAAFREKRKPSWVKDGEG
ncbi:MAG: enoyl-CoA hydratase/isomerase family protein [Pseudomonadales bacterium]|nr:enoyl-CoA hydratase/isomerase family protein [Pseudomonadales bacterium]MBO7007355.1 enoyl-CoA hydratase/isomerase family protein [Pseudomonadales bacterium]